MKNKLKKLYFPALALLLLPLLSACSLSFTSSGVKLTGLGDGGVFMSESRGNSWTPASAVPSVNGQARTISSEDIKDIAIDPSDHSTLYLATIGRGVWTTSNVKTAGWNQLAALKDTDARMILVDPQSKCTVYVLSGSQIMKTTDCGRDFFQIYQDDSADLVLTTLAIDNSNHNNLYLGNSRGDILKSIDGGTSWRVIKHLGTSLAVMKIALNPKNNAEIFVAAKDGSVYSFVSSTKTNPANSQEIEQNFAVNNWQDDAAVIKSLKLGAGFRDFTIGGDGQLFLAVDSSLARSKDGGVTWEKLTLLATASQSFINSLAVNPQDSGEIYYVTSNTFCHSDDSGVSWTTKSLPSSRAGSKLLVDYQDPEIIYLGVIKE